MAAGGRPPKRQDPKAFTVTVPLSLYEYFGYLARHSFIGTDEAEVASYILINEGRRMVETKFHELRAPREPARTTDDPDEAEEKDD